MERGTSAMAVGKERYGEIEPASRAEWRAWLEQNHDTTDGVWLILAKKAAGDRGVRYVEAVEEALCFGWIDSL
ncbi:MAG: hypothetical protein IT336_04010, partial [Thermomicrobiales bacterium]|nr:hypothetical protein [Thermomicrobiales bacterium]